MKKTETAPPGEAPAAGASKPVAAEGFSVKELLPKGHKVGALAKSGATMTIIGAPRPTNTSGFATKSLWPKGVKVGTLAESGTTRTLFGAPRPTAQPRTR